VFDQTTGVTPLPRYLRTDLHVHSTHSDGRATVEQLVDRARSLGFTLAITDHYSVDQKMNTPDKLASYLDALDAHPVYRGIEMDIGEELPLPPELRARLDLVIGSMHHAVDPAGQRVRPAPGATAAQLDDYMECYVATLTRGLRDRAYTFIGHPTHLPDLPHGVQQEPLWTPGRRWAVIEAAVAGGVAFEISTRYSVPSPTFMREAVDAGMTFATGSDSHWLERIAEIGLPRRYTQEYGLTPERFVLPTRVIEGNDVVVV